MYIKQDDQAEILNHLPDLEEASCMECGAEPRILWTAACKGLILLCPSCAQLIGVQLLKDVRNYELDQKVSVRANIEVVPK